MQRAGVKATGESRGGWGNRAIWVRHEKGGELKGVLGGGRGC